MKHWIEETSISNITQTKSYEIRFFHSICLIFLFLNNSLLLSKIEHWRIIILFIALLLLLIFKLVFALFPIILIFLIPICDNFLTRLRFGYKFIIILCNESKVTIVFLKICLQSLSNLLFRNFLQFPTVDTVNGKRLHPQTQRMFILFGMLLGTTPHTVPTVQTQYVLVWVVRGIGAFGFTFLQKIGHLLPLQS